MFVEKMFWQNFKCLVKLLEKEKGKWVLALGLHVSRTLLERKEKASSVQFSIRKKKICEVA